MYILYSIQGIFKQLFQIQMLNQLYKQYQLFYILKCKKTKNKENQSQKLQSCIFLVKKNISKKNQMNLMNKEKFSLKYNQ